MLIKFLILLPIQYFLQMFFGSFFRYATDLQPNLATHLHKNGQAQTLLDSFCRHQARINPGTDLTDPGHWDHGVLLTG